MPTINLIHLTLEIWGIIFCIIEAVCVISGAKADQKKTNIIFRLIICNMLLLLCDAMAWCFRGDSSVIGVIMTRTGNFGVFAMSNIMVFVFVLLLENMFGSAFSETERKIIAAAKAVLAAGVVLAVVSQFTNLLYYFDADNFYHRTKYHFLSILPEIFGLSVCAFVAVKNRKRLNTLHYIALLAFILLPAAAGAMLLFIYGPALGNIAATISVMFIFTAHMLERSAQLQKQQEEILRQKLEIEEGKTALLSEIIKPHFINNSLAAISGLCYEDPKKAAEAIEKFSKFLHTGMGIMENRSKITFEKEMELLDNYLYLEQQRFSDMITVHKNITAKDFFLPPLTVQPVVENAVRHGIRKNKAAGNIYISSAETETEYIIVVEDDGKGFDVNELKEDDELHIGLENVSKRLKLAANGKCEVESVIGRGTKVTISIPKNFERDKK